MSVEKYNLNNFSSYKDLIILTVAVSEIILIQKVTLILVTTSPTECTTRNAGT